MSTSKKARFSIPGTLTQGIGQALQQGKDHAGQMHYELVPLIRIDPDPDNPRKLALEREDIPTLNPADPLYARKAEEMEKLQGLASSIRRHGVQHPIVVYRDRERFRIAMGERRFLASLLAGQEHIPARIWAKRPDEYELRLLQYVENAERVDLSAWERVQNIRSLTLAHEAQHGEEMTPTKLAEITGFALSQASLYLQLIGAPADVQAALASGQLTNLDKAALVAKLASPAERQEAIAAVISGVGREALRRPPPTAPVAPKGRAGRPATKITLGATRNTVAVRRVVETMAQTLGIEQAFSDVDWEDLNSASQAWAALWQRLEGLR